MTNEQRQILKDLEQSIQKLKVAHSNRGEWNMEDFSSDEINNKDLLFNELEEICHQLESSFIRTDEQKQIFHDLDYSIHTIRSDDRSYKDRLFIDLEETRNQLERSFN